MFVKILFTRSSCGSTVKLLFYGLSPGPLSHDTSGRERGLDGALPYEASEQGPSLSVDRQEAYVTPLPTLKGRCPLSKVTVKRRCYFILFSLLDCF